MNPLTESEEKFLVERKERQKKFHSNFVIAAVVLFVLWGGIHYFIFHVLNSQLKNPDWVPMGMYVRLVIAQTLFLAFFVWAIRGSLLREGKFIQIVEKLSE